MTEAEATAIYAAWDTYPHDKTNRIVFGENLWVRVLPGRLFGLDNHPLDRTYRWQDVCTSSGVQVWRRWNTSLGFRYRANIEGARARIIAALQGDDVNVRFLVPGLGFAEFLSADDAVCRERLIALSDVIYDIEAPGGVA